MRITKLLFITLLIPFLYNCSFEQPPYEPEKKAVTICEGETSHVSIDTDLTQFNYRLESENQEIATAILDDMGICILTFKSGSTEIRLMDTVNNKTLCEISVYVKYFNSLKINDWGDSIKRRLSGISGNNNKNNESQYSKRNKKRITGKGRTIARCNIYI